MSLFVSGLCQIEGYGPNTCPEIETASEKWYSYLNNEIKVENKVEKEHTTLARN
jgi:hypothetical protein